MEGASTGQGAGEMFGGLGARHEYGVGGGGGGTGMRRAGRGTGSGGVMGGVSMCVGTAAGMGGFGLGMGALAGSSGLGMGVGVGRGLGSGARVGGVGMGAGTAEGMGGFGQSMGSGAAFVGLGMGVGMGPWFITDIGSAFHYGSVGMGLGSGGRDRDEGVGARVGVGAGSTGPAGWFAEEGGGGGSPIGGVGADGRIPVAPGATRMGGPFNMGAIYRRAREGYRAYTIINKVSARPQTTEQLGWRHSALDVDDNLHAGLTEILALPWPDTGAHGAALHAGEDELGYEDEEDVPGEGVPGAGDGEDEEEGGIHVQTRLVEARTMWNGGATMSTWLFVHTRCPEILASHYYTTSNQRKMYAPDVWGTCVDRLVHEAPPAPAGVCDAPHLIETRVGRPENNERMEARGQGHKCGRCKLYGHNRSTCKYKFGGYGFGQCFGIGAGRGEGRGAGRGAGHGAGTGPGHGAGSTASQNPPY
ncbi:unnamed protein product [Closterium sp. NIES-54]